MRYKVVPTPPDSERLLAAHEALPLVPGSVERCCTRIRDRTAIPSRDEAREWLTFLQALGLATETDRGYYRVQTEATTETLAEGFREGVFGVSELLEGLDGGGPLTTDEAFEDLQEVVPRWERSRHADWEAEWHERTASLLAWAVEFGLATETAAGYKLA